MLEWGYKVRKILRIGLTSCYFSNFVALCQYYLIYLYFMQYDYIYHKLDYPNLPSKLKGIDSPPKQIFYLGNDLIQLTKNKPCVAIVGSRKPTNYGKEITTLLVKELVASGVVIISGLAFGVDSIAHSTCLDTSGKTIAILPSSLSQIYPKSHRNLASDIIKSEGCLISEYPEQSPLLKSNFIARNRLISALSDIVIITEAAEKSGSLHTANFALLQGKTVMAVPGSILNPNSRGTNNLIKTGAIPITDTSDILFELGIKNSKNTQIVASSPEEYLIMQLIKNGERSGYELLNKSKLSPQIFNQTLTMLEINGKITALGNNQWSLS